MKKEKNKELTSSANRQEKNVLGKGGDRNVAIFRYERESESIYRYITHTVKHYITRKRFIERNRFERFDG